LVPFTACSFIRAEYIGHAVDARFRAAWWAALNRVRSGVGSRLGSGEADREGLAADVVGYHGEPAVTGLFGRGELYALRRPRADGQALTMRGVGSACEQDVVGVCIASASVTEVAALHYYRAALCGRGGDGEYLDRHLAGE